MEFKPMAANDDPRLRPVRVYRPDGQVTGYAGPARTTPASPVAAATAPRAPEPAFAQATSAPPHDPPPPYRETGAAAAPAAPARKPGVPIGFMIFCGAVIALMSMGIRNIVPLWQTPMLQDLGWTSLQFSIAIAAQNLMWGAFAPVFGGVADKYGSEKVLAFGAILQAAGLWVMSQASEPTMFFLSAGLMVGIAQSAAGMGIIMGALGRVVQEKDRTMVFGLVTSASSTGMIVLTPVGRALLENFSWSEAFVWVAILSIPVIVLSLFVRSSQKSGEASTAQIASLSIREALGEAFAHRGYVLLTLGFFVCGFHVTFIGVHLPKYLEDVGIGWQVGATALMIIGVFNVAACLAVGYVASVLSKKNVLAGIYLLRALVILVFISFPVTEMSVYIFAGAFGVLWLSTVAPTQGIVAQVFGTQYMTMLGGVVFFSHQIGSFLGVYLGAKAVDRLGSYELVWWAAIGLGVFAFICHVLIDERPLERLKPAPAPAPAE